MNNLQRVGAVVTGILMLITGAILFWFPEEGTYIVAFILAAALFLMGAQLLIYYFTMARRMVGGKSVLLLGIFLLDFCAFTVTILDEPGVMIMMYLVGWHAFSGLVDLLRAREARTHRGAWKLKAPTGVVKICIAAACTIHWSNMPVLTLIYSIGLCYAAIARIISAFRKTEVVYIQ
jgi:uncharacterized membrane protein HdeD (DUF308 family)